MSCHFSDDAQRARVDLHLRSPTSVAAALSSPAGTSTRHLENFRVLGLGYAPAPRIRCPLRRHWPLGWINWAVSATGAPLRLGGGKPTAVISTLAYQNLPDRRDVLLPYIRLEWWRATIGFLGANTLGGENPRSFASPVRRSNSPLSNPDPAAGRQHSLSVQDQHSGPPNKPHVRRCCVRGSTVDSRRL